MKKTFAVIGLGLYGRKVCEVLSQKGGEVIAIDNNIMQINKVKDFVTQAILLDSTDEDSISEAPFDQVDTAIVAIGDNVEASILTTALLKQLGVSYIVARAVNKTHYQVLKKIGADEVINIEEAQGMRIALNLISPSVMEKVQLSKNIIISEMMLPEVYANLKVAALDLKEKFTIELIALRRNIKSLDSDGMAIKKEVLIFSKPENDLLEGDVMILIGEEEKIAFFQKSGEL